MNEKSFAVLFIIALVIGAGSLAFSKFQQGTSPTPSPSPSDNLIFNSSQPSNQPVASSQIKPFTLLPANQIKGKMALIRTPKGDIEFELYPEASMAASNFISLTQQGFYNNLTFHRVEPGFVIQGGDPKGDGTGGPGYRFPDELNDSRTYTRGTVAMANAGPDTNGSQFFIMLADHPELPKKYTIFGKVTKGMDVVDKIAVGDVMKEVTITSSQ